MNFCKQALVLWLSISNIGVVKLSLASPAWKNHTKIKLFQCIGQKLGYIHILYPKESSARGAYPYCCESWGLVAWTKGCLVWRMKMLMNPCSEILGWLPLQCLPALGDKLKSNFSWQGEGGCRVNCNFLMTKGGGGVS